MRIAGEWRRTIWLDEADGRPRIFDQTRLPHAVETRRLADLEAAAEAIRSMRVRGAPLIGVTAAFGLALALEEDPSDAGLSSAIELLRGTRPTAINLAWALDRVRSVVEPAPVDERADRARLEAQRLADADVAACEAIGSVGFEVLRERHAAEPDRPLQVLTHCNAGWLATVDWGTALAPVYRAHDAGLPVHVWVDETRPRNQGAALTAFELREHGVPHTVIVDNAGGHLMQRGLVDVVLVGSDRTTARGDVGNKIGTYLKALAARAHGVPFFVCLPCSSIDWSIEDGLSEIPIEERSADELRWLEGVDEHGALRRVAIFDRSIRAANPAFDVTPAELVSGLVTEHGVFDADREALASLRRRSASSTPPSP